MRRVSLIAAAIVFALAGLWLPSATRAECMRQTNEFPRFTRLARSAETVVIGTVIEELYGHEGHVATFRLRVDEVLRGEAGATLDVLGVKSGLSLEGSPACQENAFIYAQVGDVLALALDGQHGRRDGINTAAWIEGRPARTKGAQKLTRAEARRAVGSSRSATSIASSSPAASLGWVRTLPAQGSRGWVSDVIHWPGGFAALGKDDTGSPTVWTSPDGRTWTAHPLPIPRTILPRLTSTAQGLVVVAAVRRRGAGHLASWTSRDGTGWTRARDSRVMALPGETQPGCLRIKGPVSVDGTVVVHGECEPSMGGSLGSPVMRADQQVFAFVGAETRRNWIYAWRSADGRRWVRRPVTPGLQDLDCVASDGERLVALDYGTPLVASEDGIEWTAVGDVLIDRGPPDSACVYMTVRGYLQVGVVDGGTGTSVSADGRSWSLVGTLPGFGVELGGVAVLGDTVVLDGFQADSDTGDSPLAAQLRSTDGGATWAPTIGWPSTTIATDGEVIVAVGDGAWVAEVSPKSR